MMGSSGDGADNFTTLVSLLADPRQFQEKLKALEKSKKEANVAWTQAMDAIKKSEAAKAEADQAHGDLEAKHNEITRKLAAGNDQDRALATKEHELNLITQSLVAERRQLEANKKVSDEDAFKKSQELRVREAAVTKREAEADAEIKRQRDAFEKEKATHLRSVEADHQAAAAARKEAESLKAVAEKLRNEHQSRLEKLVALASGR